MTATLACIVLALFVACEPPPAPKVHHMTEIFAGQSANKLNWGNTGKQLQLRGPFGQVIALEGDGPRQLQWAPEERDAQELEFRAFILNYGPNPGFPSTAPLVRWGLKYGHGQMTYQLPIVCPYTIEGGIDAYTQNVLPARGLVLRMQCREFEITFSQPSKIDQSAAWPQVQIAVSMQPVYASQVPLVPKQHYSANLPLAGGAGTPLEPFPPEATEFRVFDEQGQPYPGGAGLMSFITLGGQLLAAPSLGLDVFADFQPIPVLAAAWGPPFDPLTTGYMVSAEYR